MSKKEMLKEIIKEVIFYNSGRMAKMGSSLEWLDCGFHCDDSCWDTEYDAVRTVDEENIDELIIKIISGIEKKFDISVITCNKPYFQGKSILVRRCIKMINHDGDCGK